MTDFSTHERTRLSSDDPTPSLFGDPVDLEITAGDSLMLVVAAVALVWAVVLLAMGF